MKAALIIGATSGIGKDLVNLLAADNYKVIATGRRKLLLDNLKNMNHDNVATKIHDVTNLDSCEQLFLEVKSEFKTIDLVVYSSGIGEANYKLDWGIEEPILETNVLAATKIYGLAYAMFHKQGHGHLVGISSIASIRGNRYAPSYFASKSFQASYLESLWMKAKRSKANIVVTDIQPGFVDTPMALGDTFWMASVEKATKQIYNAIKKKKRKAYITKRWWIISMVLKIVPAKLLFKFS